MLVTLDSMKEYLGIPLVDTSQDVFLTEQLTLISDTVLAYCGRSFEVATYAEHFYSSDFSVTTLGDTTDIFVTNYPIISVSGITRDGVAVDVEEFRVNSTKGFLRFDNGFFRGSEKMVVTYSAGYAQIPLIIQSSVKSLVQASYNKKNSGVSLGFGNDVQRVSIPGTISIDFDYTLESNTRKSSFGTILGNYLNVFDFYRSEKRVTGSARVEYVF